MSLFSSLRTGRSRKSADEVHVSEKGGIRSLHLGSDTVQSSMRIAAPFELALSYTRAMMGFLLFHSAPRQFLMIGLGGGSLAKYVWHRLPEARTTVIENNERIIAAARSQFALPANDERLHVEHGDGAEFIRAHPAFCDVLMVDAYDAKAQVEALATEDFYSECRKALEPGGVLVVNLWSTDPRFDTFLQRIERVFDAQVVCLPAERKGNVAVFAFDRKVPITRWDQLKERARTLEAATGLEMLKFVGRLGELNPHSEHRLLL